MASESTNCTIDRVVDGTSTGAPDVASPTLGMIVYVRKGPNVSQAYLACYMEHPYSGPDFWKTVVST